MRKTALATIAVSAGLYFAHRTAGVVRADEDLSVAEAALRAQEKIHDGHRFWYEGEHEKALAAYEKALQTDPRSGEALLNGAVVLEELGRQKQAVEWLRHARELAGGDARVLTALGWAEFRARDFSRAALRFDEALRSSPKEVYALLGLGRALAAQGKTLDGIRPLTEAVTLAPLVNAGHVWKAQVHEQARDSDGAFEAYKKAIINDSYFTEARYALGRAYMREGKFNEANLQFSKILDVDPDNARFRQLKRLVGPKVTRILRDFGGGKRLPREPLRPMLAEPGDVPLLRVGVGTNIMGKPWPRKDLTFRCDTRFQILDASRKRTLAAGDANDAWRIVISPAKQAWIEVFNPRGRRIVRTREAFVIRPDLERGGMTLLGDIPFAKGYHWGGVADKRLRGEVEVSPHPAHKRAFRLINIVDLESYTHGLLSAEMPITSPLEALKAQSVVARSEALYMKLVTRRHRKDEFDVCDEQHCQVYAGANAESERSRMVVNATRGRILAYQGRVAHGIYASNCGGHTQAGRDIAGWGDVGYWPGVRDAPAGTPGYPSSPWGLRWWLKDSPAAFCMPTSSGHVHASHYRWTRIVPARELEERLARKEPGLGKLLGLRALKRSPTSGHVNGILLIGSKKQARIRLETRIRNLLGLGSQRSTLFTIETEFGADRKPEAFVFHGAGWGHGVGMCQSGAMGRAEQGQTYVDILKAYYPSTELGTLRY